MSTDKNEWLYDTPWHEIEDVFTEWHRRYTEDPTQYDSDWAALPDTTYGERAAAYFRQLLEEI